MTDKDTGQLRVNCPGCGAATVWREDNPSRPFCSAQCRNKDFLGWAEEKHHIPGSPEYDELFSGETGD